MAVKEPENDEDRLIVEEINRKKGQKKKLEISEMQFMIHHYEYFIDSEVLKKIDKDAEEYGKILEKCCVRVRCPSIQTRRLFYR